MSVSKSWESQLATALGGSDFQETAERFSKRIAASYIEQTTLGDVVVDISQIAQLKSMPEGEINPSFGGKHRLVVRPSDATMGVRADGSEFRIRRYGTSPVTLSNLLPVIESFGLIVVDVVPHLISGEEVGDESIHLDDIGLKRKGAQSYVFDPVVDGNRLVEALEAIAKGQSDTDQLNSLVTTTKLTWRQIVILRTYCRYLSQCNIAYKDAEVQSTLVGFPLVASSFIEYFEARFSNSVGTSIDDAHDKCESVLSGVPHLRQDAILRILLHCIEATQRTNYFLDETKRDTLVVKINSAKITELSSSRISVESFVHSPKVEGIHVRAGLIARGGIRFSDRPLDFRTEVIELALTQVKKNANIVPTGAKGGFVDRSGSNDPLVVQKAYELFISGLLDITDNIVDAKVVTPSGVVAQDGPDPYLVVAADKGTASYSDLANSIADRYGFWLGDAFASGGSVGYDHKEMGITAKGAWVSVARHFRQLGIDVSKEPISVAGVGDMSGDVFGNGMLCSPAIKLVAAFDHRHIFIDPDPDLESSFAERMRLAELEHSSWAEYRAELISTGGGVWPRDVKSIPLHPAVRELLKLNVEEISPPDLISAILSAPIDLLWFGGIGTYIKAPRESDSEVDDHSNDQVRINSDRVRARVVAEGGNLGVTQLGRVKYSRRGGRINTDFIDNAAGVITSDREVNIKILLLRAIELGLIDVSERAELLRQGQDFVAEEVLRQIQYSVSALERGVSSSSVSLDEFEELLGTLEKKRLIKRDEEFLPGADEFVIRRLAGAGLVRPELAILLAYTKSDLIESLESSALENDPLLQPLVASYFPPNIRSRCEEVIPQHYLYSELLATLLANEIVDRMGITWIHETAAELEKGLDEVAAAYFGAREVIGANKLWQFLEANYQSFTFDAEEQLHELVVSSIRKLARCYLLSGMPLVPSSLLETDGELAQAMVVEGSDFARLRSGLSDLGIEEEIANQFLGSAVRGSVGEIGPVVRSSGRSAQEVIDAFGRLQSVTGVADLVRKLESLPSVDRWSTWQVRAILDDIRSWKIETVTKIVASEGNVVDLVEKWRGENQAAITKLAGFLERLNQENIDVLTMATLLTRRLP